jgi:hypothetical protein
MDASTTKTIWMVTGNKGGVGKSLFCLSLATAFDMSSKLYSILDGDGRTGDVYASFVRVCPRGLADFRGLRPDSHDCRFDLPYEKMIHELLLTSSDLIINTPDGADNILLKWFDVTLKHTEENNYQFKLIYLISDRGDGLEMIDEFALRFPLLYPVKNLYFGNTDLFLKFNGKYRKHFRYVMEYPVLRAKEVRLLFDHNTYPFEACNMTTLGASNERNPPYEKYVINTLPRARIMKWQKMFNDNIQYIMDNDSTINVKY